MGNLVIDGPIKMVEEVVIDKTGSVKKHSPGQQESASETGKQRQQASEDGCRVISGQLTWKILVQ